MHTFVIYRLDQETLNHRAVGDPATLPRIIGHYSTRSSATIAMEQRIATNLPLDGWTTEADYAIHTITVEP